MTLRTYKLKRKFAKTPEPKGSIHAKTKTLRFVVQEHHASHLHWDFRLELDGVLKSWAVPKGPSMDPKIKHLAVQVEDHPYSYRKFHGIIPTGNYGAGTVKIWDEGTYTPIVLDNDPEKLLRARLKKGDLKFILHGKKLKGTFVLVQLKKDPKNWLLIKEKDHAILPEKQISIKGKRAKMPHDISPMLAKLAEAPFNDSEWVFEIKWDGYRAIAEIENGEVKLYSRNQQNFNEKYPEIMKALQSINSEVILDGEIVAVDEKGTPQFQLLQDYSKNHHGVTLIYYVFDLLYLDGRDLRGIPLIERKKLLKELLPITSHLKYSDHIETYGLQLFDMVKSKHIEGIIAKRKRSLYVSSRSSNWLKMKNIQMQEAIICGFTEPNGHRKEFGALILGIYENGELRYAGHTGGGFDEKKLHEIIGVLKPLITDKSPFPVTPKTNAPATWVKPKKVCQIKFSEWTQDGVMRQPVFLGLREDKKPENVTKDVISKKPKEAASTSSTKNDFSNLDKVFWPKEGYTKGDVIAYYEKIAPFILPYLKDRPESMNRHPNGITGESFFQKDILTKPKWVKTIPIYSESDKKTRHWLICNDKDTLLYMANLGCIEINPWSSRIPKKNYPDYLIIDLDPNGVDFKEVITTAKVVKRIMDKAKMASFIKTSGKTGLHILVPMGAMYTFDQTRKFAEILANVVAKELPHTTSVIRDPQKREKKIYIDFLQNRHGQTIAAPYSLRPVPGVCVSTPLEWDELKSTLSPSDFTIKNILKRLEKKGDIWKGLLSHKGINMLKSLKLLHT
ncbi:MAG TPA: DNA ligase D [Candidatus Saccharimonadales bacterium]|nr:DNA ligase D [Candidatus Saccharimonadales bacterium]